MTQTFKQEGPTRYCTIGVHYSDRVGAQLLAINRQIVIFSTLTEAQWALPRLGGAGRAHSWSADRETIVWTPINPNPVAFNRAVILTGYDPYNIPAGGISGIKSESRGLDWHSHILFNNVMEEVLNAVDGLEMQRKRLAALATKAKRELILARG